MNERRVRIVRIAPEVIVDVLNVTWTGYELLSLPECEPLPSGCKVTRVHYDFCLHRFLMEIYHPSFDVVPDGEIPPHWTEAGVNFNVVRLVKCERLGQREVIDERGVKIVDDDSLPVFVVKK